MTIDSFRSYQTSGVLGTGSTGVVYLAENPATKHKLAVKMIDRSKQSDSLLKNEARIHRALKHPNIVSLKDIVVTKSYFILVMEYLSGGDLFDAVSPEYGVGEIKCKHYFRQIVSAVEFMHQNGVVHRDIKPENVVLDARGDVCKLLDFGFSCPAHMPLTQTAGTMPYMAPECLERVGGGDDNLKAVDVWALGILLFTLVTGSFPWGNASDKCPEFVKFCNGELDFQPWATFTPELIHLFKRMLCINPEERCSIGEVAELLDCHFFINSTTMENEAEYQSILNSTINVENGSLAHANGGHVDDTLMAKALGYRESSEDSMTETADGAEVEAMYAPCVHSCFRDSTDDSFSVNKLQVLNSERGVNSLFLRRISKESIDGVNSKLIAPAH
eukprot:Nk52_evm59s1810 gene=Nk52_evmTU59s1810